MRGLAVRTFILLVCCVVPLASQDDVTLHVIPQAHIDLAWWWRYDPQTVNVAVKRTLETAFANLDAFPDYTFTFLQVPAIQPLETLYPDLYYKFHYYLFHAAPMGTGLPNPHGVDPGPGRLKIAHALWDELDASVPSGESLVRQCLYGKRYFQSAFGLDVRSAWFQDAWTHPWTYPQILKKCGIDSYMFTRGRAGENDERMFWWESPDGSRVFAYKPASRGGIPTADRLKSEMAEVSKRYGVKDEIALVGVGNHGGGYSSKDIADMRKLMDGLPGKARFSTHTQFLAGVLAGPHDFPVVRSEISPVLRGTYTTLGEIKKLHRESENLILTLEKFASIAAWLNAAPYPKREMDSYWQKLMLNQSHDAIGGTTIPPATDDALQLFREILDSGGKNLATALHAIARKADTRGEGTPVVVFNPLSWERGEVAEVDLPPGQPAEAIEVRDPSGKPVAAQSGIVERNGISLLHVRFLAEHVPSLGYRTFHVMKARSASAGPNTLRASAQGLENEFLRVSIDPQTGCVSAIFDKRTGRDVLDASRKGNLIQVIEDFGDSEGFLKTAGGQLDTAHKWTGKTVDVDRDPRIEVLESGPVRAVVQVKKKWELARFTQRIILYAAVPRVDFELDVDWKGRNKMVKVGFPVSVSSPEATYEIPYGNIRRPSRGEEQPAQKWVDISDGTYGVSLLNDGRYGYDVTDRTMRLSVLRSPTEPVFATDETGVHSIRYALFPHAGEWRRGGTVERGYELNYPLLTCIAQVHAGGLPASLSFLSVEPKNMIVEALKRAEDADDRFVVRLYESEGAAGRLKLTWAQPIDAIHQIDLLERDLADLPIVGRTLETTVGAYSIESFKMIKDR
jgi:alpha-mannosidase